MGAICEFYHLDKLDEYDILNRLSNMVEKERHIHGDINLDNYEWQIGLDVYHRLKTSLFDDLPMDDTCSVCIPGLHNDKICGVDFKVWAPNIFNPNRVVLCKKKTTVERYALKKESENMSLSKQEMACLINVKKPSQILRKNRHLDDIKNVIFNDPATIVFWVDGTKTVVKAEDEPFDPEKGLAMAIAKKHFGNRGNYYDIFRKWLPEKTERNAFSNRLSKPCYKCKHYEVNHDVEPCASCLGSDNDHWEAK